MTKSCLGSLPYEIHNAGSAMPSKVGAACTSTHICGDRAALPPCTTDWVSCRTLASHSVDAPCAFLLLPLWPHPQMYLLTDVKRESLRLYKSYDRILALKQASRDWQDE